MKHINRRRFLLAALAVPAAVTLPGRAGASAATHSLWMLDPDWGFPLSTSSGSDTKSRCRTSACHKAAPHRYFLSEADAIAGRLHPCCLAQPVRVDVCVDLNELMPYYRARLGGVDNRCPELPDGIRTALYSTKTCVDPEGPSSHSPTGADTDPSSPAGSVAVVGSSTGRLPATGSSMHTVLAAASAATIAGVAVATATSSHPADDHRPNT